LARLSGAIRAGIPSRPATFSEARTHVRPGNQMPKLTRVLALLGALSATALTTGCVADGYGGGGYYGGGYSSYPSSVYVAPQPVYVQRTVYVSPRSDYGYWRGRRHHRRHDDRD
jgi:hypothetical protein